MASLQKQVPTFEFRLFNTYLPTKNIVLYRVNTSTYSVVCLNVTVQI